MSDVKNAVVVGKVALPQRRVVEVAKKAPPASRGPRQERKRDEDRKYAGNQNRQMLAELQYVKKQLRTAQEQLNGVSTAQALFVADVKALM